MKTVIRYNLYTAVIKRSTNPYATTTNKHPGANIFSFKSVRNSLQ